MTNARAELCPLFPRGLILWATRAVTAALVISALVSPALADESFPDIPRIRTTDPHVARVLDEAERLSPTLRHVRRAIEATNGIVYIEAGRCRHSARACLLLSIVSVPGYRILRVRVNPRLRIVDLAVSLGHELQHAAELLSNQAITTDAGAYMFFSLIAPTGGESFETEAAVHVGYMVGNEVAKGRRAGGEAPQISASNRRPSCELEAILTGKYALCGD